MIFRGAKTGKSRVEATFYLPNTSISGKECGAILGGGHWQEHYFERGR